MSSSRSIVKSGRVAESNAGIDFRQPSAQPGIDADDHENAVIAGDDDVAHAALTLWPSQELVEIGFGRQHEHIGVHDLQSVANEKHVGVQRFGNELAAARTLVKLSGVLAAAGSLLMLNGYFLLVHLPFE